MARGKRWKGVLKLGQLRQQRYAALLISEGTQGIFLGRQGSANGWGLTRVCRRGAGGSTRRGSA